MKHKDRSGFCYDYSVEIDGERLARAFRKAALDGLRAFMEGLEAGLSDQPAEPGPAKARQAKAKPAKPKAAKSRRGSARSA